jgi:hypothetical protein
VPYFLAALTASMTVSAVASDRAAKMPPVWSQRTPSFAEELLPVDLAGADLRGGGVAAVGDADLAPRTPKPRSVKLRPLRTVRPMPSLSRHTM